MYIYLYIYILDIYVHTLMYVLPILISGEGQEATAETVAEALEVLPRGIADGVSNSKGAAAGGHQPSSLVHGHSRRDS